MEGIRQLILQKRRLENITGLYEASQFVGDAEERQKYTQEVFKKIVNAQLSEKTEEKEGDNKNQSEDSNIVDKLGDLIKMIRG